MKTSLLVLSQADDCLLQQVKPCEYLQELSKLCQSCGWNVFDYWNELLSQINNNWEVKKALE